MMTTRAAVLAYARQRLPLRVFGPVIGLLAAAGWWAGAAILDASTAVAAVVMALQICLFRVWDDLEDREDDRRAHPERILPKAPLSVFTGLRHVLGIAALAVLVTMGQVGAAIGLGALMAAAHVAYRQVRTQLPDGAWSFVLLLKYPACVAIVSIATGPVRPRLLAIAALVAYAGACVYEDLHNRFSRAIAKRALT